MLSGDTGDLLSENRQMFFDSINILGRMSTTKAKLPDRCFRVIALDPELANRVRRSGHDEFGHPVQVQQDDGKHQCRSCLQLTEPRERYLLLSHSPFKVKTPYSERGPIFLHHRNCVPYASESALPPDFPRNIVLRGYDESGAIVVAELSNGDDLESLATSLLRDPRVAYVHCRNRTYGCYMYRLELAKADE